MFDLVVLSQYGNMSPYHIKSITLPTSDGQRTILARHMEIYVEVEIGVVTVETQEGSKRFAVSEGIFHFKENKAALIVSTFESEDEIDFIRAKRAYDRAKTALQDEKDIIELQKQEQALKRALARLNLE